MAFSLVLHHLFSSCTFQYNSCALISVHSIMSLIHSLLGRPILFLPSIMRNIAVFTSILICCPFDRCARTGPSFIFWFGRWCHPPRSLSSWLRHSSLCATISDLVAVGNISSQMHAVCPPVSCQKRWTRTLRDSQIRCEGYVPTLPDLLQSTQRSRSLTYSVVYELVYPWRNRYPMWWCFLSIQKKYKKAIVLVFSTFIWRPDALTDSFISCRLVCSDVSKGSMLSANRKLLTDWPCRVNPLLSFSCSFILSRWIVKIAGEIGSPCLVPLPWVNQSPTSLSILMTTFELL